jgi:hypothetical protein
MGPIIFVAQLVLYPLLNDRFSSLGLWRTSAAVLAAVYPLFSLLPHISENHQGSSRIVQWVILLVLLAIRFTANVVAYTSISVLVSPNRSSPCAWHFAILTHVIAKSSCRTGETGRDHGVSRLFRPFTLLQCLLLTSSSHEWRLQPRSDGDIARSSLWSGSGRHDLVLESGQWLTCALRLSSVGMAHPPFKPNEVFQLKSVIPVCSRTPVGSCASDQFSWSGITSIYRSMTHRDCFKPANWVQVKY